jgi:3-hydroxyisobutyrate dehydrogenase-like beta-hydroxyacid dehydrogenase
VKVGFVGLGTIGKPIAVNILKAGFDLMVFDARKEPVKTLARLGAKAAHSCREVGEHAEIIGVAVVDDCQVEEVVLGKGGVLEGARPGTIIAIHSTIFPKTVKRVAENAKKRGVYVIDAAVSGGEAGAREKALCYMVGGDKRLLKKCRALFSVSASHIFHMGEVGMGAAAKMMVQVVVCVNMLAAHEAAFLCGKSGLAFSTLQEVLRVSSAQSFVVDHWLQRFKRPDDPIAVRRRRTEVFHKSLSPALDFARDLGLSLPGAALARRLLPQIMGIEGIK